MPADERRNVLCTADAQARSSYVGSSPPSAAIVLTLEPEVLASGHGEPWSGPAMRRALRDLASHVSERKVPSLGRCVRRPALTDERGFVVLPPDPLPKVLAGAC